jgi:hypothetical protein
MSILDYNKEVYNIDIVNPPHTYSVLHKSDVKELDGKPYYLSRYGTECREILNLTMCSEASDSFIMCLYGFSVSRILKKDDIGESRINKLLTLMGVNRSLYKVSKVGKYCILVKLNFKVKEKLFTFSLITFALKALSLNTTVTSCEICFKRLHSYYLLHPDLSLDTLNEGVVNLCDEVYRRCELTGYKLSVVGLKFLGKVLCSYTGDENLKKILYSHINS